MNSPSFLQVGTVILYRMPNKSKSKMTSKSSQTPKKRVGRNGNVNLLMRQAPVSEPYIAPEPGFKSLPPLTKGASVRYVGCDYIGSDSSSSSAASTGSLYGLAALNSTTFPRLSNIADTFLKYRYNRLRFHMIGKSASTQAGTGAWASFVTDAAVTSITVNTEAIIKNAQGALVMKGWESGFHDVLVDIGGQKWYNTDQDTAEFTYGALAHYIPQTTASGDLSWDVYVEYDVEFGEAVSQSTVALLEKKLKRAREQEASNRIEAVISESESKFDETLEALRSRVQAMTEKSRKASC